ncbi:MAG: polysaccharide deacetylase family protein [Robiginitomaculum sp.]|nr:polysaccharide deacetylase family protein [Robiginitomaculum sp.]
MIESAPEPITNKRIALSFDDAPRGDGPKFTGDERTKVLIDALAKSESGPVVFFVTTKGFGKPSGKQRIERYAKAGHLIANHSHAHQWLMRMDTQEYIADIDMAEQNLTGISNRRPWFRFPFLDEGTPLEKRDAVRNALKQRGLINGYVTIDTYDWHIESRWKKAVKSGKNVDMEALQNAYVDMLMGAVQFYDEMAVETFDRSPVHTLLLHENDVAALFIDDLVVALRADGWEIVSPDEAYADPIASIEPQTLKTRQGHVAALAFEAGRSPKTFSHLAISEKQIDAFLLEREVFGDVQKNE